MGINLKEHDVRFEEDNWESPTLGAWGIGWQILLDGLEITQFTYFQQCGGVDLDPISVELTYGLDRIAAYLQGVDNVFDVRWSNTMSYRQVRLAEEQQFSAYSFDHADAVSTRKQFDLNEAEAARLLAGYEALKGEAKERFPVLQAYDLCLKCSHLFNLLDARGAISVTERAAMIGRVRKLATQVARAWLDQRASLQSSADGERMKSRGDFLFEIGCEEIPAGMILKASQELKAILAKHLSATGLVDEPTVEASIETFGAPRRLTAIAKNVRLKQEDVTREVIGPPKSVAFDIAGQPTRAAISFAEKQGIPLSKLEVLNTPKGEYMVARQVILGKPAAEILREFLPEAIREISWPRSMVWAGLHSPRFIRPIRWIVALLDGKVIPFSFADVRAGNWTDGHRFLGSSHIPLSGARDYESKLKKNFVLCRPEARRKKIEAEIQSLTARKGFRTHADPELLDLVTYLNEYPTVILGDFDPSFLSLPEEILITVMRGHQKYFAVEDRDGELTPHFLAVINLPRDPKGLVRAGHERVLRARFADARFFWETDQKIPLGDYLPKLSAVTYERRLGSYGDKVERMRALARWLAEQWFSSGVTQADVAGSDRAAELAKCDLVTEMVREFTELQGIVGGLYARAQGEPEEIAWAVYDQYKPIGLDDPIPRNLTGCAVALADKLDSLWLFCRRRDSNRFK